MEFKELNDIQWAKVTKVLPPLPRRTDNRGRPWNNPREVLNGILWVITHHTTWPSLPRENYPPFQTCHRWFQRWLDDGTLEQVVDLLGDDLKVTQENWFSEGKFSALRRRNRLSKLNEVEKYAA
ncbi:MAG: transposase [Armatimonas sp.]